jgi:hypothetical protein
MTTALILTDRQLADIRKGIASADEGLRYLLTQLNDAGYHTIGSCSGLMVDHDRFRNSYIQFIETSNGEWIEQAAKKAGLMVRRFKTKPLWWWSYPDTPTIEVAFSPVTQRGTYPDNSDDLIRRKWRSFRYHLLGR